VEETAIYDPRLPAVSARGTLLLAGFGLVCLGAGLFVGTALLIPAGLSGLVGLVAGLSRFIRVWRGAAYFEEGKITLVAATFVNAGLAIFVAVAGWIVLKFGV
jgi:hypothetical protein